MDSRDEATAGERAGLAASSGDDLVYTLTGDCPRCGAPIYQVAPRANVENVEVVNAAPVAHFTCACRFALPDATPIEEGTEDSAEVQDRKYLARHRTADEPASEERVGDDR